MASLADKLPRCNFLGVPMPMISLSISGERAIEIHKYRFTAGGKIEDHKRSLWAFTVEATFQTGHRVAGFDRAMFPDALNILRGFFQNGSIGPLTIPHIGQVFVITREWSESTTGVSTTGANVTARFLEYGSSAFDQNRLQDIASVSFDSKLSKLAEQVRALPDPLGLFDQIFDAANQIIALRDQTLAQFDLAAARIDSLTGLLIEADRTIELFDDPTHFILLEAFQDLWAATVDLVSSPQARVVRPRKFVVDETMTVMEVSQRVYGSNDRARDILELNQFDDAMRIPAGTTVLYLPDEI